MTKTAKASPARAAESAREERSRAAAKIHPVVVYPFKQPPDRTDLEALYKWVSGLTKLDDRFVRPITVMDRKTFFANQHNREFLDFRENVVGRHTDVLDAWCVDTCQMWYAGLGSAFERGTTGDVYWLIPGDFNYGTPVGQEVLQGLHDLPEIILELDQDLCIGEIAAEHGNSKQLIDTYGTFALLYNWFPVETQEIRQFTERPRSEFFAVCHRFLREVLSQRWYPYEQTVVMLLHAVFTRKRISRFFVGHISDLPCGTESLTAAVQQVERAERVLKAMWRERNQSRKGWMEQYRALENKSEQIRRTALTVLENLLA